MNAKQTLSDLQTRIYRDARAARGPVPRLMTWLLERRNLEAAWDRVRKTDGANTPGSDGVTCDDLRSRCDSWLSGLADDLLHDRYRPAPPRWVDVPKHNSPTATRRIGILTVRDRVVHAGLKQVLEPVLEPTFSDNSYGFRPGRSVPSALEDAARLLEADSRETLPFRFGVHLDVADCFDTIDQGLLLDALAVHVSDARLLSLVETLLAAGGRTARRLWSRRTLGLVQGSALSPLLCNLYLHPLDELLARAGRDAQNGLRALRYADDVLLLARDEALGRQAISATRRVLRQLGQRLRNPHAEMCRLEDGVNWLGVRIRPCHAPWSDRLRFGYVVPDEKVCSMCRRLSELTAPPNERIDARAFDLGRWIVSVNTQLRDWRQAYLFADNAPQVFRALDEQAFEAVGALLAAVTGLRRRQLVEQFRLKLARGFKTWHVGGCRLVVLSALAPHRPDRLVRRPAWQTTRSPRTRERLRVLPVQPKNTPAPPPAEQTDARPEIADASA